MKTSYVPTRMMAGSKRVYKSTLGKLFNFTTTGGRTYRPKATHVTKGDRKFVVKPHYKLPYGMKPKAKYSRGAKPMGPSIINRILAGKY
jgi:hypothetical protein